jgi:hypothetical protein
MLSDLRHADAAKLRAAVLNIVSCGSDSKCSGKFKSLLMMQPANGARTDVAIIVARHPCFTCVLRGGDATPNTERCGCKQRGALSRATPASNR